MFDLRYLVRRLRRAAARLNYCVIGDAQLGRATTIGKNVVIHAGFVAGDFVYIGQNSHIGPRVRMGNFCMVSDQVQVIGHDHVFDKAGVPTILAGRPTEQPQTVFEDDVWIGHGCTIMRGVSIGEGSIVGANSVVTRDIPPYTVYVGVPAKRLRNRFLTDEEVETHRSFLESYRTGRVKLRRDGSAIKS